MPGFTAPPGAVATSTSNVDGQPASMAIDCDVGTAWNAGMPGGTVTIAFPQAVTVHVVHLATQANPPSHTTFDVFDDAGDHIGAMAVDLGSAPFYVIDVDVTPTSTHAVSIAAASAASFAAFFEITFN